MSDTKDWNWAKPPWMRREWEEYRKAMCRDMDDHEMFPSLWAFQAGMQAMLWKMKFLDQMTAFIKEVEWAKQERRDRLEFMEKELEEFGEWAKTWLTELIAEYRKQEEGNEA